VSAGEDERPSDGAEAGGVDPGGADRGGTDPRGAGAGGDAGLALLRAAAVRAEAARRILGEPLEALLRSVVDATVALFQAEAASIALFDAESNRLVFRVAAGDQGQGVVGQAIPIDQGVAGYAFSTGQAIALADVSHDPRFAGGVAALTGYVPRSLLAVPLIDGDHTIGVLEVLDKREAATFSLRDVDLAGVFARQAAVAINATRIERDTRSLLAAVLVELAGDALDRETAESAADEVAAAATENLDRGDDTHLWALAERVARLRRADPEQLDLLAELLDVLVRRTEASDWRRRRSEGGRRRSSPTPPVEH
jgi:GAF domain-containing protein